MKFSRVLGCQPYYCVLIKKWLHQGQFIDIFRDHIVSTKKPTMDFYSGSHLQSSCLKQ